MRHHRNLYVIRPLRFTLASIASKPQTLLAAAECSVACPLQSLSSGYTQGLLLAVSSLEGDLRKVILASVTELLVCGCYLLDNRLEGRLVIKHDSGAPSLRA